MGRQWCRVKEGVGTAQRLLELVRCLDWIEVCSRKILRKRQVHMRTEKEVSAAAAADDDDAEVSWKSFSFPKLQSILDR